jgi:hypothetical protein
MLSSRLSVAVALLLFAIALPVRAEISGFATLGSSWFSNPHADFAYNNGSTGPGNSRTLDVGLDSNLGLQWSTLLDSQVRLTAQTVIYRDASNQIKPDLTLLNALFPVSNAFSVRIGRSQNPNFLYSDYRQVHYALPWIRPPREVYGVTSFFDYDGAQVVYRQPIMLGWELVALAGVASASMNYSLDSGQHIDVAHGDAIRYASISLQRTCWTIKLSYETGVLTAQNTTVDGALDVLRQTSSVSLADQMALSHKDYQFVALGVRKDSADWLLVSEFSWRSLDAYFGQRGGAYVTLGRHLGRYMPYMTLARTWTLTGSSPNPVAQALYDSVSYSASSLTLGLAYELSDRTTLKTEIQGIAPDAGSRWVYESYDRNYNYTSPDKDLLLSVSVSTVF